MTQGRRLQFRPWLTVFTGLSLAILLALGNWQLQRRDWKNELIEITTARVGQPAIALETALANVEVGEEIEYLPVRVAGEFDFDKEVRVFGARDGAPGYFLFTPLKLSGADTYLYINRGFAPQSIWREEPNAIVRSEGIRTVDGLYRAPETRRGVAKWFAPENAPDDGLWHVRDPILFASHAAIDAAPYYIDQLAVADRPWPKGGTTRLEFNNRHLEYALTWFGLAGALIGVWLIFSLQNSKTSNNFKK